MGYSGNFQADLQDDHRNSEPSAINCPGCGWTYPADDVAEAFCEETRTYSDTELCPECTAEWIKEQTEDN